MADGQNSLTDYNALIGQISLDRPWRSLDLFSMLNFLTRFVQFSSTSTAEINNEVREAIHFFINLNILSDVITNLPVRNDTRVKWRQFSISKNKLNHITF